MVTDPVSEVRLIAVCSVCISTIGECATDAECVVAWRGMGGVWWPFSQACVCMIGFVESVELLVFIIV